MTYTLEELARRSGMSHRTIRYYTSLGLLPQPLTRGRYAVYGEEHLLRLRMIDRLRRSFLPLKAIRLHLERLTVEEMRRLLAAVDAYDGASPAEEAGLRASPAVEERPSSASEYIARVLGQSAKPASPPGESRASARPEGAAAFAEPPEPPALMDPGSLRSAPPPSVPAPILAELAPEGPGHPGEAPAPRATAASESWERIALAPGLELHVRAPASPEARDLVRRVVALARALEERS